MSNTIIESTSSDEIILYNYWKVIVRRRKLLIGVFLAITITTAAVNLIMPKIYRGTYIIKMATDGFIEIVKNINECDKEQLKKILPNTYKAVTEIKLVPVKDSLVYKLKISIDVKDTVFIPAIASETIEYINNFPFYRRSVNQGKERIKKNLDEISNAIINSEEMLKTYNLLLKGEKLVPLGFNPIESYSGILSLKNMKVNAEQSLNNYIDIEIITQMIYSNPVKPRIIINIVVAALIGFFAGLVLVFIDMFSRNTASNHNQ